MAAIEIQDVSKRYPDVTLAVRFRARGPRLTAGRG